MADENGGNGNDGLPFKRGQGIRPEQITGHRPEVRQGTPVQAPAQPPAPPPPAPAKPIKYVVENDDKVFARLPLLDPITLSNGATSHEIIIYRPTCGAMTEVLDTPKIDLQVVRFVSACCRAVNGSGEALPFDGGELSSIDGSDLTSVIAAMAGDADAAVLEESGDGITSPLVYTLKRPVQMSEDGEAVTQFEFMARKIKDISEYLDARGETKEFHTFMRTFGKPIGLRFAIMSDVLINAIDFLDYLVIRRQILPKFVTSRGRWKRGSSLAR